MIILSTTIIILTLLGYKFKLKSLDFALLLLGILLLFNFFYTNNKFDNIVNKFSKIMNNEGDNNNNKPKILKNNNLKLNWTSDSIIPLNKYNPRDCTNDNSCIIPPDKYNQYPTWKNAPKLETRQNLDTNLNNINIKGKYCMICLKNIDPLKNPITENFTSENPYGQFEDIVEDNKDDNKNDNDNNINNIKRLYENITNNNNNHNLPLSNIKKLSDKICHHCKIGLCVNDGCLSV